MQLNTALFRRRLLAWFQVSARDLPWRRTRDPYAIWVSEVMLQQTRIGAVLPFYERFLTRFPTLNALSEASEHEVLALWSGLGYYSRARNLQRAAREMAGGFPPDYAGIRALPGVGDYTAAAVASIAFGLPHAAVDGNVLRVMARITGDAGNIGSGKVKTRLSEGAARLLDRRRPGDFNQAMMELGATVCLPRNPQCGACPVAGACQARQQNLVEQLPVKSIKEKILNIHKTVCLVRTARGFLMRRRPDDADLLAGFWELPEPEHLPKVLIHGTLGRFRHSITHRGFVFRAVEATIKGRIPNGFRWITPAELTQLPVSTTARKAIRLLE